MAPQAPQKLSGRGKRLTPQLTWTQEMRITLDILQKDSSLTWELRSKVFNHIWQQHIQACGFVDTVPCKTLQSQCNPSEKKKNQQWIKLAAGPKTNEERAKFSQIEAQVRALTRDFEAGHDNRQDDPSEIRVYPAPVTAITPQGFSPHRQTDERPASAYSATSTGSKAHVLQPAPRSNADDSQVTSSEHFQPLSKRPAIAVWDPEATALESGVSQRAPKRQRMAVSHPQVQVCVRRRDWSMASEATVSPATLLASPSTASRSSQIRNPKVATPKRPYHRPYDIIRGCKPLSLTEEQHRRSQQDLIPVPEELAHAPLTPLLYRYWVPRPAEDGRCVNSETGFVAGRYAHCVRMYQPPRHPDWTDILNHIGRRPHPSPYISVSNAFFWVLRNALKEANKQNEKGEMADVHIAIIDARRLDKRSVFYVPPFHTETKKKFGHYDGAWNYSGTHEFLVEREIPGSAIIRTVRVRDLVRLARGNPVLEQALALQLLTKHMAFQTSLLPTLRRREIGMTVPIVRGIASLIDFMGCRDMDQISHVVADIVQGWAIQLEWRSTTEWAQLASVFAESLPGSSGQQAQPARLGFLDGLRWGCSKHFNTGHSASRVRKMQKQARKVGLEDPMKILLDELDAAKIRVRLLGAEQARVIQDSETRTRRQQRVVMGHAVDEYEAEDDDDEDTIQVRRPRHDHVGEEDDELDDDVFEMGEDGLVL
ncbi:Hypothetical predicted protein [Lecanosticta acicola]|uniref:DUF7587 domain-containing protein n=1 Tax=Lecanosticta acicola TaxID=111012 RepID=A0AAI9EFV0_9PEZI|nr:Hypothetical predicted protein [Lecanosticta acicola]